MRCTNDASAPFSTSVRTVFGVPKRAANQIGVAPTQLRSK
jgi:hypothetical protein